MENSECSSCRVNKPITEFNGFKTCNKCRAKKRERTANNGYLYCHVCERRVNPEIWDFHLVGGCHQDNMLKHLKADYQRLVEEAPTQEFKDKYFQEGQERIQELKMTMPLYNPALRRNKVVQVDGDELD